MKLVIVRPRPGAEASAAAARHAGFDPLVAPLFEIRPLAWGPPKAEDYDALLLTSANALRQGGPALREYHRLPVLAVGEKTAKAARAAGFEICFTGNSGIEEPLGEAERAGFRRLLRLTGSDHVAAARPGLGIDTIAVYEAAALPAPQALIDALAKPAVILLHSPRAARRLAALCREHRIARSRHAIAALSPAVAEATGSGWRATGTAARPREEALLASARKLCKMGPGGST